MIEKYLFINFQITLTCLNDLRKLAILISSYFRKIHKFINENCINILSNEISFNLAFVKHFHCLKDEVRKGKFFKFKIHFLKKFINFNWNKLPINKMKNLVIKSNFVANNMLLYKSDHLSILQLYKFQNSKFSPQNRVKYLKFLVSSHTCCKRRIN